MAGNTFGKLFRITTWGESHGKAVGVIIDGCPPRIPLDEKIIQEDLDRRKPGSGPTSTARKEKDQVKILSGTLNGLTTGTPIALMVENRDVKSSAYNELQDLYRPGHADFTYQKKYGIRDWRGGGRASARETVGRVAAGAVARKVLSVESISVVAYTLELGGVKVSSIDLAEVNNYPFRTPDKSAVKEMTRRVAEVKKVGDSIGGVVEVVAHGVAPGLGEPVFDKLDAELAKALMSIGAVKGVEIGAGFDSARSLGSHNNDPISTNGFLSNNAGGILGGVSNGEPIVVRAAVKPIPSIEIEQQTITVDNKPAHISVKGRHDVSAIPRINAVCEAMVCLTLVDLYLRQKVMAS
ncbi:MAG: chorismate synthase [Deltaproteobacteria bacterium]|nr:chorismate synthase [Deltaproteobacteria bacterium]